MVVGLSPVSFVESRGSCNPDLAEEPPVRPTVVSKKMQKSHKLKTILMTSFEILILQVTPKIHQKMNFTYLCHLVKK